MTIAGMSATGYSTVGDIVPTHMSIYHAQSGDESLAPCLGMILFGP
ncbi:hypothetical protein [Candidatus Nitrospira allomarina]|jgi:cytidylate kinase|uniref:Uncharacterized protein n=1 Tax=Candidatus Nitrospira allomarina TaxID=3020900 RepID=A0AA96GE74_9BACT|nr:hypothetical protein [Candidatus Nitrospira allomarina]WNM60021.1 hypothetical protein PP769_09765 [Candidatus Nitrospira allomarina]